MRHRPALHAGARRTGVHARDAPSCATGRKGRAMAEPRAKTNFQRRRIAKSNSTAACVFAARPQCQQLARLRISVGWRLGLSNPASSWGRWPTCSKGNPNGCCLGHGSKSDAQATPAASRYCPSLDLSIHEEHGPSPAGMQVALLCNKASQSDRVVIGASVSDMMELRNIAKCRCAFAHLS